MLTLTMKENISVQAVRSAVNRFITKLNWEMHGHRGRQARTKSKCRIIAIPSIEGQNGNKRIHVHLILGNIPTERSEHLGRTIQGILNTTTGSMPRVDLTPLHETDGASLYLAMEVGYVNNDAIAWDWASIPSALYTPPKRQTVAEARRVLPLKATRNTRNTKSSLRS
ncbi:hypothetical protein [Herbaspirillum sp. YR522]|uniref:hypothetical protein n=1 Tax=Herbaspirillum sp. YR522 TaxID=1144342 RepID=UPI0012F88269|nr:hypothetical protein [Herbaspirillum sp. YR522]